MTPDQTIRQNGLIKELSVAAQWGTSAEYKPMLDKLLALVKQRTEETDPDLALVLSGRILQLCDDTIERVQEIIDREPSITEPMKVKLTKTVIGVDAVEPREIIGEYTADPVVGERFILGKLGANEGWCTLPVVTIIDEHNFTTDVAKYHWEFIPLDAWTLTDSHIREMAFKHIAETYKIGVGEIRLLYAVEYHQTAPNFNVAEFATRLDADFFA